MSIAKSLGLVDLAAALCLIFTPLFPSIFIRIIAIILILKGAVFFVISKDLVSGADVLCGAYMIFITLHKPVPILSIIAIIFLAQKAIFSMTSQ